MGSLTAALLLPIGLALLVAGGELLVRGASRLAASVRIPPLVVGLTVVAFGTSAPELAVSIDAGLRGASDIAVGNVVGSNVFNTLFILGACALIRPLIVSVQFVRREVPVMVAVSALFLVLARDGRISWPDGGLLVGGILGFTIWSVVSGRREAAAGAADAAPAPVADVSGTGRRRAAAAATLAVTLVAVRQGWIACVPATAIAVGLLGLALPWRRLPGGARDLVTQTGFIVAGLGLLVAGAQALVDTATIAARFFGISELVIGLTIVAAGTSLPEVATSITAALRGERDIAIGNVVGSNIFNILGIVGLSALVTPGGLVVNPALVNFDIPIMIGTAVVCLPIFFTGLSVARWEGALFLASYAVYVIVLVLIATRNPALATFVTAVLLIGPLVMLVLVWSVLQEMRGAAGRRQ